MPRISKTKFKAPRRFRRYPKKTKNGFRSGSESRNAARLDARGVDYRYEEFKIQYEVPARITTYTPDFELPNGIIVEIKGEFSSADRKKHLLVKAQHPELDIRFVFDYPNAKLYKGSKTSYAKWCDDNGFIYAAKEIPHDWIDEDGKSKLRGKGKLICLKKN